MNQYLDQISRLVTLQHIDARIWEIEKNLVEAPREVEELTEKYQVQQAKHDREAEKLDLLKDKLRVLNEEEAEEKERLQKNKARLMQVSNDREYNAVIRDMDSLEHHSLTRDEEKMLLRDRITEQQNILSEIDKVFDSLRLDLEMKKAGLDERLAEYSAKLEGFRTERDAAAADIPAPVLTRYEFIRRRLEHPVIVAVKDCVCTGCHIAIPPQTYIELQRGQQIWSCPNCQRLVYWDQHFHDEEAEMKETEKPAKPMVFAEDII
ncbi:MAG: hypothetical protein J5855_10500 [Mailhella sp.]|nr:hypothetical protein [Mailhella sp.]